MKLTKNKIEDLKSIIYYIPYDITKYDKITEKDIKDFYDYDEKGLNKEKFFFAPSRILNDEREWTGEWKGRGGFNALLKGKERRELHMRMFEETINDIGGMIEILKSKEIDKKRNWIQRNIFKMEKYRFLYHILPNYVFEYMKKSLFKGNYKGRLEELKAYLLEERDCLGEEKFDYNKYLENKI